MNYKLTSGWIQWNFIHNFWFVFNLLNFGILGVGWWVGTDKIDSTCIILEFEIGVFNSKLCRAFTCSVNSSLETFSIAVLPECGLDDGRCCERWRGQR